MLRSHDSAEKCISPSEDAARLAGFFDRGSEMWDNVVRSVQVIKDFIETERRNKKGKTELRLQGLTGHEAAEKVPSAMSPYLGQSAAHLPSLVMHAVRIVCIAR